jgi:hypothetical protein
VRPTHCAQHQEAPYGHYGYAGRTNVNDQAASFLPAVSRLRPFSAGNRGTALNAVLPFLALNGYTVVLEPQKATAWYERAAGRTADARGAVLGAVAEGDPMPRDLKPAVRTIVRDMLKAYPDAVTNLEDLP